MPVIHTLPCLTDSLPLHGNYGRVPLLLTTVRW
uniref:Uncharacterized protein n=1 Tax=Anguilla anguilla TaxID=7936 RepID=A0A0E9W2Z8_ANGAN